MFKDIATLPLYLESEYIQAVALPEEVIASRTKLKVIIRHVILIIEPVQEKTNNLGSDTNQSVLSKNKAKV